MYGTTIYNKLTKDNNSSQLAIYEQYQQCTHYHFQIPPKLPAQHCGTTHCPVIVWLAIHASDPNLVSQALLWAPLDHNPCSAEQTQLQKGDKRSLIIKT